MTVKLKLKEIRVSRGMSQNKLARAISMTLQNVQRLEYGDSAGIQFDTLEKLCIALDCQPGDLLVRIPEPEGDGSQDEEMESTSSLFEDTTSKPAKKSSNTRRKSPDRAELRSQAVVVFWDDKQNA